MLKAKPLVLKHFLSNETKTEEFDAIQESPELLEKHLVWEPFCHMDCYEVANAMLDLYEDVVSVFKETTP